MEGTSSGEGWATVVSCEAALQRVIGRLHQAGSQALGPMFQMLDRIQSLARRRTWGCLTRDYRVVM
jgi:hypothetical protein